MASRRSHAPTNDKQIEYELRVPRSGTYIMKPTASCEAAQLWVRELSHLSHKCSPKGRVFKILIILMSNLSPKYPPN